MIGRGARFFIGLTIVGLLLLFSFALGAIAAAAVDDDIALFVGKVKESPSFYTLIFEEDIDAAVQAAILDFASFFKITKSNIDRFVKIDAANMIVIGNPEKNKVMKDLGASGDPTFKIDSSKGEKLLIGSKDPEKIKELLESLKSIKPSSGAAVNLPPKKQLSSQPFPSLPSDLGKDELTGEGSQKGPGFIAELLAPLRGNLFVWLITFLIISPIFGLVAVQHSQRKKRVQKHTIALQNYIGACMQRGFHPQYLKQNLPPHLIRQGWDKKIVEDVFSRMR
ncbi:hypothetical protein HYU13_05175 [Candidatus Woesearchaeota archaeon]|nr:hypothetical protein [Candidatus Woesearchaeota archaeon]